MDFDTLLKKQAESLGKRLFPAPLGSKPSVHIGTDILTGRSLHLPIEDLASTHTYVPGRSGVGKSKFLERIARDIIKQGYGLIFLDGKGDLYDNLVDFCAVMKLEDKTVLIDPNDDEYSVGINYLELLGGTTPDALAGLVLEGLKKFFKEDQEYKPWLEEWAPAALVPLIKEKFTLLELFHFLNLQEPSFRETVLGKMQEEYYQVKWDGLKDFRPHERSTILNALRTRSSRFWQDPALKGIFGQQKTTVDWLKVMNEGGIVLAKLGRTTKLPENTASFIGAAILHQITTLAPARQQGQRKPCFFMIDEFQKFVTSDFADAFDLMRGYGLSFIMAHQHRSQLERDTPEILNSIDSNCRNKFVFSISRKDAETMALELFTGWIDAKQIKDEIRQTKLRPVKVYEEIVSHSTGTSSGASMAASSGVSMREELLMANVTAESQTSAQGTFSGESTVKSPWYDYEEYQEVSSRTYVSIEEAKENYIAWVKKQADRHAQWQFKAKKPIPIETPFVKPLIVTDSIRRAFVEKVHANYHRPRAEVLAEVEGRIEKYLGERQETPVELAEAENAEPAIFRVKRSKPQES